MERRGVWICLKPNQGNELKPKRLIQPSEPYWAESMGITFAVCVCVFETMAGGAG